MIVFEDSSLKWRAQSTKPWQVRVFYCRDLPQNKTQNWTPNDLHAHVIVSPIPLVRASWLNTLSFFCGQSARMSLPNLFCDMSNLLFSSYVLLNEKLTLHCRFNVCPGSKKLLSAVQILDKESEHGKFVECCLDLWYFTLHGWRKVCNCSENAQVQEKKWITKRCHLIEVSYTYEFSL